VIYIVILSTFCTTWPNQASFHTGRGCCGRDHMVVGFTTTYAISAYHHWCWVPISIWARCTTLCDKVRQWLAAGRFFSRQSGFLHQ